MTGEHRAILHQLFAAALLAPVCAQAAPAPKTEAELDTQAAQALVGFARNAETWKAPSRARAAYQQVLDHYDADHSSARAALGWKRVGDEWQLATPAPRVAADAATPAQRKLIEDAWRTAAKRVATLHEVLAQSLDAAGHRARAVHHFERALVFAPDDVECHTALGHEEFEGFRGTAEQIAFVRRMRALRAKASELAAQEVEVEPVPAERMPAELAATGIPFVGARGKHVTYWVAGTFEEAANCCIWNTRAVLLLQYLFGEDRAAGRFLLPAPTRWIVVLRSAEQRDRLLQASPATRDGSAFERSKLFGGQAFSSRTGAAEWSLLYTNDDDHAVGHATKRGTPAFNSGFSEGLVHCMTHLLCGTTIASYMQLPTTVSGGARTPREPSVWLRELRAQIERGEDWPLVQIPRERMENFREPVRFKSWSFVTWLMARHPEAWIKLLAQLGHEKRSEEDVAAIFEQVLGRSVGDVETEWRDWVRPGSRIGKASGLP